MDSEVETFPCPECGRQITKGPSGTEYGHNRGVQHPQQGRCSRRPDSVDPKPLSAVPHRRQPG